MGLRYSKGQDTTVDLGVKDSRLVAIGTTTTATAESFDPFLYYSKSLL